MAKRWINSADVLVDDQGRIGVIFPTELLVDNQLRIDTAPIVGPAGDARTLADLYELLFHGLFDFYGYPIFEGLEYYLYDPIHGRPWMQTIHNDLEFYLYDWGNQRSWLETLHDDLSAIRGMLADVYDSAQHALRTV